MKKKLKYFVGLWLTSMILGINSCSNLSQTSSVDLKEEFSMYFDLDTFKGLEIYFWEDDNIKNEYYFGLLPGTNRIKTIDEIKSLPPATLEQMREILLSYNSLELRYAHLIYINKNSLNESYYDENDSFYNELPYVISKLKFDLGLSDFSRESWITLSDKRDMFNAFQNEISFTNLNKDQIIYYFGYPQKVSQIYLETYPPQNGGEVLEYVLFDDRKNSSNPCIYTLNIIINPRYEYVEHIIYEDVSKNNYINEEYKLSIKDDDHLLVNEPISSSFLAGTSLTFYTKIVDDADIILNAQSEIDGNEVYYNFQTYLSFNFEMPSYDIEIEFLTKDLISIKPLVDFYPWAKDLTEDDINEIKYEFGFAGVSPVYTATESIFTSSEVKKHYINYFNEPLLKSIDYEDTLIDGGYYERLGFNINGDLHYINFNNGFIDIDKKGFELLRSPVCSLESDITYQSLRCGSFNGFLCLNDDSGTFVKEFDFPNEMHFIESNFSQELSKAKYYLEFYEEKMFIFDETTIYYQNKYFLLIDDFTFDLDFEK